MIRYLYSKVNLWEGMYFFSILEDKMIYQARKMGTAYFFWKKGQIKRTVPFLCTEKVGCPLFM